MTPSERDWQIRLYIYHQLIATGAAPTLHAIAEHFAISVPVARQALRRLHNAHALVIETGSDAILMAHPLSAQPTDYRVQVDDIWLYANCAWDSLGIPAMLARDAPIEARHPISRERIAYAIVNGELQMPSRAFVHFAQPFRHWYDDISDT